MSNSLRGDLNLFGSAFPKLEYDYDLGNVFGSNPSYDEARGPQIDGDGFIPIDEVAEEPEDPAERWDRILDDPAPEVEVERRAVARMWPPVNRVDPNYDLSVLGKPELSALFFEDDEFKKPALGTVTVARKKTVWKGSQRARIDTKHVVAVTARHGKKCVREPLAACVTKPGKLSLHR
jgi:hypothetical protein